MQAAQTNEIPSTWNRYDDETYLKQPRWENDHTGQVVYIAYNPNLGGYSDPREWSVFLSEDRTIDSETERIDAHTTRDAALEREEKWMRDHPEGDA